MKATLTALWHDYWTGAPITVTIEDPTVDPTEPDDSALRETFNQIVDRVGSALQDANYNPIFTTVYNSAGIADTDIDFRDGIRFGIDELAEVAAFAKRTFQP